MFCRLLYIVWESSVTSTIQCYLKSERDSAVSCHLIYSVLFYSLIPLNASYLLSPIFLPTLFPVFSLLSPIFLYDIRGVPFGLV
jgi:hypothetical protein